VPGGDNVEVPWPLHERIDAEEGSLDTSIVDQLVPLLAAAPTTSTRCHYGLWRGFGEFAPRSGLMVYTSAKSPWGRLRQRRARSVRQRRADATRQEIDRRSPQWWWPEDRAWFVATEIDDPWTCLASTDDLIAAVEALDLESVRVSYDDLW